MRWAGECYDCGRERELESRTSHHEKALCDECAAKPHTPPSATGLEAPVETSPAKQPAVLKFADSWTPVDLGPIVSGLLAGEVVGPVASLMPRNDGPCLLYAGELHSFAAEPESGKSWMLQAEAARLLQDGQQVAYLDFEDSPANVIGRLLALGTDPARILAGFVLVRPENALAPGGLSDLLEGRKFALAVIDGVTEAMGLFGLEIASNDDIAKFRKQLARPLAANGAAVVEIDHVVKNAEARGRFALGGGHKLAGVAVAYSVTAIERPSRTREGLLKVTVEKDRHGRVREHEDRAKVIALARITPADNGKTVTVGLEPPDSTGDAGEFRPTRLMERVSRFLESWQDPASKNTIEREVTGKAKFIRDALEVLVNEGYVGRERTPTGIVHLSTKPYREADEDPNLVPSSQPRPNLVPDEPRDHLVPSSPPYKGDEGRDEGVLIPLPTSSSSRGGAA